MPLGADSGTVDSMNDQLERAEATLRDGAGAVTPLGAMSLD